VKIEILDLARDDLINGYHFYEDQSHGIGDYFLTTIYSDIEALKFIGGTHPIVHQNFHRALSKRFPWAIYYTCSKTIVKIYSIVDCRRDPDWIEKHLKRS
jgi:hypothetical protein